MGRKKNRAKRHPRPKQKSPQRSQPHLQKPESPACQSTTEEQPSQREREVGNNMQPAKDRRADWWMVVLTGILCLITYLQWRISRDAWRTGARAYVCATQGKIIATEPIPGTKNVRAVEKNGLIEFTVGELVSQIPEGGKPFPNNKPSLTDKPIIGVEFTNSGSTPATSLRISNDFIGTISHEVSDTEVSPSSGNLGVGGVYAVQKDGVFSHGGTPMNIITPEDRKSILDGKKFLVIYGSLSYHDIFGEERHTLYCYQYQPKTDSMGTCAKHNRID